MRRLPRLLVTLFFTCGCAFTPRSAAPQAVGPLRVDPTNPRVFSDGAGKAVYLTGSHTWSNFAKDEGTVDPPLVFDFNKYLDWLTQLNHNFFRGWTWELPHSLHNNGTVEYYHNPFPWPRTGPGNATDGKPRFDLTMFNQAYFDRMRTRLITARDRGFYVSVMLFDGWGLQSARLSNDGFPLDLANNVNGINGNGTATQTLQNASVTAIQEAYVRKIIDTVNDLDNVLYEIANESGGYSTSWQYHMINFVKQVESTKPKKHPVGMTVQINGGGNTELFNSPADWISPNGASGYGWPSDPPAADGRKVILNDTDHSFYYTTIQSAGQGGQREWVWKNFLRGNGVLFMDPYLDKRAGRNNPIGTNPGDPMLGISPDPYWDTIRKNMGYTLAYAQRMNLITSIPQNSLSSTAYCLANPGSEYLVYQPSSGTAFTVTLVAGTYAYEWFNPTSGAIAGTGSFTAGAGSCSFTAPFTGDAVLYLTSGSSAVAPTITTPPSNQTVTAGQTATFSVVASGTPPLSYQWQRNGVNISGAMSASYTTPPTTLSDSGSLFRVVVSNPVGSATSTAATLTVSPSSTGSLPVPWQDADVGSVGMTGSASYASGTFTVCGSGADIWSAADAFHFAYQPLSGDGEIVARVVSQDNTSTWAKAGVMIRETFAADSAFAMTVVTPGNGTAFQRRTTTGGMATTTAGPGGALPHWVKIARSGDVFTGSVSPDGATWTAIGPDTILMISSVYIGLCVTAHNNAALSCSGMDSVAATPGGSGGTGGAAVASGGHHHRCGSTGLELLALLGVIWLFRRAG